MAARSSFSTVKAISALVADNLSVAAAVGSRRTYAAAASASQGITARSGSARMTGGGNKAPKEESVENSWVPDPQTGYYRPANRGDEIDVAELRRELLKSRTVSH